MDITSANATISITIPGLYNAAQQLQGFAAEDIFETDSIDTSELLMGADGNLSAGFIFVPVSQRYILQADSPSNDIFDQWYGAEQRDKIKMPANATILLVSINRKWTMTTGFLSTFPVMPDGKKVLQPRKYGITWSRVSAAASA